MVKAMAKQTRVKDLKHDIVHTFYVCLGLNELEFEMHAIEYCNGHRMSCQNMKVIQN